MQVTKIKYTIIFCVLLEIVGIIIQKLNINIEPEYIFYFGGFVVFFYSVGLIKIGGNYGE